MKTLKSAAACHYRTSTHRVMAEVPPAAAEPAPVLGVTVHVFSSQLEDYGGQGTDVSVSVWGRSLFTIHCQSAQDAIALLEHVAKETKKAAALDAVHAAKRKTERMERRKAREQEPHMRYEIAAETYEDPCEHVH